MASLKDRLVVVTGAASGIGLSIADLLFSHGALLSLADVNENALAACCAQVTKKHGQDRDSSATRILTTVVDVRTATSVNAWISKTVAHFQKPIAGAANMAGVIGKNVAREEGAIRNLLDEEFEFVMDVNCKGIFNCLRAQLPAMQTGLGGRGGGSIVNASSMAGTVGVPLNAPYVASKHAVAGLTRTAAKEEGGRGIRVNAIAPGIIATPMIRQIEVSKGSTELFGEGDPGALARKGDAEEVASLVVFLLSEASSFISGQVYNIDGGFVC
ncbi:MAG: hypothetical protein Q9170_004827 [Blastenia crenularia]